MLWGSLKEFGTFVGSFKADFSRVYWGSISRYCCLALRVKNKENGFKEGSREKKVVGIFYGKLI